MSRAHAPDGASHTHKGFWTWTVIAACGALVLAGCGGGAERDDSGAVATGGALHWTELKVGDCVLLPEGDEVVVEDLEAVPCDTAHDGEVYLHDDWAEGDYPGEDVLDEQVLERCDQEFEAFVGGLYDETELDIAYFYPLDKEAWEGDRSVLCMAYHPEEQVTGTLAGTFEQHLLPPSPAASTYAQGDCVDSPDGVSEVKVPCDQAHMFEIYSVGTFPVGDYLGDDEVQAAADVLCEAAYGAFVGVSFAESELTYWSAPPTAESWAAGDLAYACAVLHPDYKPLTGSVQGSGR